MRHTNLIPDQTRSRAAEYLGDLRSGKSQVGKRLGTSLAGTDLVTPSVESFLDLLINTKIPQIFAESAVAGDGTDWNLTELGILGDISISVPVTVFDNGLHSAPTPHSEPLLGTLVFTPGALLKNGRGCTPADWDEATLPDDSLDPEGYHGLYERRLLPVFQNVDAIAAAQGKPALLTIPGLGCGCFAGPFAGKLGAALQTVLERFLETHGALFPNIRAAYYDPYNECSNQRTEFHGISFFVRPHAKGNQSKPQLCHPTAYGEEGDDFSDCILFSVVAWDHVSWPGNDFFAGSRCTDDGVKAAATDSMAMLTGVEGRYDPHRCAYLPPPPYRTWREVVSTNGLSL